MLVKPRLNLTKNQCHCRDSHIRYAFKIARGVMAGVETGVELSAKQCLEIGRQAIANEYYYQAVNWAETALAKVRLQNDTTASLTEAEIQFETARKVVGFKNTEF